MIEWRKRDHISRVPGWGEDVPLADEDASCSKSIGEAACLTKTSKRLGTLYGERPWITGLDGAVHLKAEEEAAAAVAEVSDVALVVAGRLIPF